jgi:hypothetical protein
MNPARPFSGPISVSVAGLTLLALSAASFTSGLSHQMRAPRPNTSAKVVVITPAPAPTPIVFAPATQGEPAAPAVAAPHRRLRPPTTPEVEPTPTSAPPVVAAIAAPEAAIDAAAITPIEAPSDPQPTPPS